MTAPCACLSSWQSQSAVRVQSPPLRTTSRICLPSHTPRARAVCGDSCQPPMHTDMSLSRSSCMPSTSQSFSHQAGPAMHRARSPAPGSWQASSQQTRHIPTVGRYRLARRQAHCGSHLQCSPVVACNAVQQHEHAVSSSLSRLSTRQFPRSLPKGAFLGFPCANFRSPLPLKRNSKRNRRANRKAGIAYATGVELANGLEAISNLGMDTLTFLCATVLVVPAFKKLKISPILGFLLSGVVLNQMGIFRNVDDIKALSELGILFLLFEMGLELSLARLQALAKYAFGMGLLQVLLSTLAFTAFELPPNNAIGTQLLENFLNARPDLVNIRSADEAIVIGAALAMSSSAFVLQILSEKGELPTKFGSATLGILLLQDIAVVPLLVIIPLLSLGVVGDTNLWPVLLGAGVKAVVGLGLLLFVGRLVLRRAFEVVAESRSSEAFVALCLLTVTGTALITQKLGFSDSLGAFVAGILLAETNYRTQVEADIRPFRGLLLGLFFVITGTSIDVQLLVQEWPNILALLAGLIAIKTAIITSLGSRVGLTLGESVRTGLLLSQGGEFAFVIFSLANQVGVLPEELNQLLIIVVVLSMALTPALYELGKVVANIADKQEDRHAEDGDGSLDMDPPKDYSASEPVVILGFGSMGQVLANFLETPLVTGLGDDFCPYVAFDLNPSAVRAGRKLGFPVIYGDGAREAVLASAGIRQPRAFVIMYAGRQRGVQTIERVREAFPGVPIYARAQDLAHLLELKKAGASDAVLENAETSLRMGSMVLQGLGVVKDDVAFLRREMRESMEQRAQEVLGPLEDSNAPKAAVRADPEEAQWLHRLMSVLGRRDTPEADRKRAMAEALDRNILASPRNGAAAPRRLSGGVMEALPEGLGGAAAAVGLNGASAGGAAGGVGLAAVAAATTVAAAATGAPAVLEKVGPAMEPPTYDTDDEKREPGGADWPDFMGQLLTEALEDGVGEVQGVALTQEQAEKLAQQAQAFSEQAQELLAQARISLEQGRSVFLRPGTVEEEAESLDVAVIERGGVVVRKEPGTPRKEGLEADANTDMAMAADQGTK